MKWVKKRAGAWMCCRSPFSDEVVGEKEVVGQTEAMVTGEVVGTLLIRLQ